jgi:O-antigen ligase
VAAPAVVVVAVAIRRERALRWIVPLTPILPLVLLLLLTQVARSPVGAFLSRRPGDIESATGRTLFWAAAVQELREPAPIHLVGWGQYGQATSGVSGAWRHWFLSYVGEAELMSLHNMSLQLVFDTGYLGYLMVLFSFWWLIGKFARWSRGGEFRTYHTLIALLLYYLFIGTTEASVSLFFTENLLMIYLIMFAAVARSAVEPERQSADLGAAAVVTEESE